MAGSRRISVIVAVNGTRHIMYQKTRPQRKVFVMAAQPRFPPDCSDGFLGLYFVISGDTMTIIAQRFRISTETLIAENPHITDPNVLVPGDVLCVPGFRRPTECPPGFQGRYEVQFDDTMFSVARRFNVVMAELIAANPHIPDPNLLFPFDELCVPIKEDE